MPWFVATSRLRHCRTIKLKSVNYVDGNLLYIITTTSRMKLGFRKIKLPSIFHPNDIETNRKIFISYRKVLTTHVRCSSLTINPWLKEAYGRFSGWLSAWIFKRLRRYHRHTPSFIRHIQFYLQGVIELVTPCHPATSPATLYASRIFVST